MLTSTCLRANSVNGLDAIVFSGLPLSNRPLSTLTVATIFLYSLEIIHRPIVPDFFGPVSPSGSSGVTPLGHEGMRVAFIHPDLGLGGAERLVVDAALSLQELGHSTIVCTPFQDANRTFREVAPPAPQVPVRVVSLPIPRSLFGRLQVS